MRDLKPTVLLKAVTEPFTWDNYMELVRGTNYVVDTSDNPRTRYLTNNSYIMAEQDPKKAPAAVEGVQYRW